MTFSSIGASEVVWGGKTYPEIASLGQEDGSVLVIPVGSQEQHGHHLPVSTDTILADTVAISGSERASDEIPVLVTPPVWSGHSPHHLPFGGTLSADIETLLHLLEDVTTSALENGFDAALFLNGHGGNAAVIGSATSVIGTDQPDAELLSLSYSQLMAPFIDEIRDSDIGGMSHAGEMETALMMHLRPELVNEDGIDVNYRDAPYELGKHDAFENGPLSAYRPFTEYTDTGPIGDPSLASAEKGEEIFDRLSDELAELLVEIHERHR